MVQLLWKQAGSPLKKLNIKLPSDPAILLIGMYLRELKTYVHTESCIEMFIIALLIVAKKVEATHVSIS